ncbi:MAG: cytidine deaminase [Flavobacterium sp.]
MEKITINTSIDVYKSLEELEKVDQELMLKAIEIRKTAYAPYSNFEVGVALLLENGAIVLGNNQENAAYPSGLCAERVAIFAAACQYPNVKFLKIFISATSRTHQIEEPIPPCGACRQSISEYEIKQETPIKIYFMGAKGKVLVSESLKNLLPLMFDKKFL